MKNVSACSERGGLVVGQLLARLDHIAVAQRRRHAIPQLFVGNPRLGLDVHIGEDDSAAPRISSWATGSVNVTSWEPPCESRPPGYPKMPTRVNVLRGCSVSTPT